MLQWNFKYGILSMEHFATLQFSFSLFAYRCILFLLRSEPDVRSKLPSLVLEQQLRSADTCTDAPPDEWLVFDREWTVLHGALGAQRSTLRILRGRTCTRLSPQYGTIRQSARPASVTATIWSQLEVSRCDDNWNSLKFILCFHYRLHHDQTAHALESAAAAYSNYPMTGESANLLIYIVKIDKN